MVKCTKKQIRQRKTALRWKIPAAQRERVQMVLLGESGMTQPAIAEAMGVSLSTGIHMAYDGGGIKALKPKPIGGRRGPERQYQRMDRVTPFHPLGRPAGSGGYQTRRASTTFARCPTRKHDPLRVSGRLTD